MVTKIITPVPDGIKSITTEQIRSLEDRFAEHCRGYSYLLPKDASQKVIEEEGDELIREMFDSFQRRVARYYSYDNTFTRLVTVNRDIPLRKMQDEVSKNRDRNRMIPCIFLEMPVQGSGKETTELHFFKRNPRRSIAEYEQELADQGLVPDYYAQMQVNIDDPAFADKYPNAMFWDYNKEGCTHYLELAKDDQGKRYVWCNGRPGAPSNLWLAGKKVD